MRAIILAAGQGRRLLPFTHERPKCLVPILGEKPILELQLEALAAGGVDEAVVVTGFGADQVDHFVGQVAVPRIRVRTLHNPFWRVSDNLVSCWVARSEMLEPFLLLNGDTLFGPAALERLLEAPAAPLALAVSEKSEYDADDMKVSRDGTRLRAVSKTLAAKQADAESIGLMWFRGMGPALFRTLLRRHLRSAHGLEAWYLTAVNSLARMTWVETVAITGLDWWEIDSPEDLVCVRAALELIARNPQLYPDARVSPAPPPTRRWRAA